MYSMIICRKSEELTKNHKNEVTVQLHPGGNNTGFSQALVVFFAKIFRVMHVFGSCCL